MVSQKKSRVALSRIEQNIEEGIGEAISQLGGIEKFVKRGDRVVIKPNLAYPYPPPATTDPCVVEGVAKLCRDAGAREVWIGDSSSYSCKDILGYGKWSNREVIEKTGMKDAAERAGAVIKDFDLEPWQEVDIPEGIILRKVEIASAMLEADVVINIPAMKTHFETLVTLGIKNYHGIIPDRYKIMFHKDEISQKLVDIHKAVKTHLTVMDALKAMEGLGPRLGASVPMNLILASADVVALDAVACMVMDIDPGEVETIRLAGTQGIGRSSPEDIEVAGCSVEEVRRTFARPDVRISGLFPGITIIKGGPCVHCYGRARIFLETLQGSRVPDNGNISTMLVGIKPRNPDLQEIAGDVVFIGDCAIESSTNLRYALGDRAICLEGCPPIPSLHREIDKLKQRHGKG
jgi:uncharacterized protein (DUF362 family)